MVYARVLEGDPLLRTGAPASCTTILITLLEFQPGQTTTSGPRLPGPSTFSIYPGHPFR